MPAAAMIPNVDQGLSALRTISAAVLGWAAGRHLIGDDTAAMLVTVLPILFPLVWGLMAHSEGAKIRAVEDLPGVTAILVHPEVPPDTALMAAANDPARPKIEVAKATT